MLLAGAGAMPFATRSGASSTLPGAPLARPAGLRFTPSLPDIDAAWRALDAALDKVLRDGLNPRRWVIPAFWRARHLYTLQSWNFENLDSDFLWGDAAVNHALVERRVADGRERADALLADAGRHLAATVATVAARSNRASFSQSTLIALGDYFDRQRGAASLPQTARGELTVLWGDTQIHSSLSYDAMCSPTYCYRFARDLAGLDFAALTDHAFAFERARMMTLDRASAREIITAAAQEATQDDRFVALEGYEWGGRFAQGHYNLVCDRGHLPDPLLTVTDPRANHVRRLWDSLADDALRILTIPHHTAVPRNGMGNDLIHAEPRYQRLIEIVSENGDFEFPGQPMLLARDGVSAAGRTVSDALLRGMRLGIVGQSDTHSGTPGLCIPGLTGFGGKTGMTAVLTSDRSPTGIFDALAQRRCYATDGRRILLDFTVNGAPMGSELYVGPDADLELEVRVAAPGPLQHIEILRNERVWRRIEPVGNRSWLVRERVAGEDTGDMDALTVAARSKRTHDFFRVRVEELGGWRAWSSPIWIDYTVGTSGAAGVPEYGAPSD